MSEIILVLECVFMLLLLGGSAFFSSAETALFSLNTLQIRRLSTRAPAAADRLERLREAPNRLLSTILVGNTIVNVTASALGFAIAERLLASRGIHGEAVAIPAMTLALLIAGEVGPKRIAVRYTERLAIAYSRPLEILLSVLAPLRWLLDRIDDHFKQDLENVSGSLTEDEFLTVVEVGEEEGVLDEEERTMVDGILGLEESQASDIMTPRVDLTGINLDDSIEGQETVARSVQFHYLPIYRESMDNVEGFLDVPKFLLSNEPSIKQATIKPFFVPETARLDRLLATFQRESRRVAIVVDEFGGTAGLVTRGDILEEIVDDVDNEYAEQKLDIQLVADNCWLIDGATSLDDINYELDTDLEAEGADRIAGWVSAWAGHLPRTGEVVEAQGCRVTVKRVRKQRLVLVELERLRDRQEDPPV